MDAIDNHIFAELNRHERAIKEIVELVNCRIYICKQVYEAQ